MRTSEQATAETREAIETALANNPPPSLEGAVCTGWVLVSEWMPPEGDKWLARVDSEDLTNWTRDGMLEYGREENWEHDEPEDD